jgi:hypothetical protein
VRMALLVHGVPARQRCYSAPHARRWAAPASLCVPANEVVTHNQAVDRTVPLLAKRMTLPIVLWHACCRASQQHLQLPFSRRQRAARHGGVTCVTRTSSATSWCVTHVGGGSTWSAWLQRGPWKLSMTPWQLLKPLPALLCGQLQQFQAMRCRLRTPSSLGNAEGNRRKWRTRQQGCWAVQVELQPLRYQKRGAALPAKHHTRECVLFNDRMYGIAVLQVTMGPQPPMMMAHEPWCTYWSMCHRGGGQKAVRCCVV